MKLFGVVNRYDLREEFPVITVRKQYLRSAVDELLWIWQKKSNNVHDLNSHIWDAWADETGSIGKAYGYQLGVKHHSAALLSFIFAWNSFTFPLILASSKVQPITVAITKYLSTDTAHYGQLAVAATVSAIPAIVFALCIQKHLVRGLSFGAVKG